MSRNFSLAAVNFDSKLRLVSGSAGLRVAGPRAEAHLRAASRDNQRNLQSIRLILNRSGMRAAPHVGNGSSISFVRTKQMP